MTIRIHVDKIEFPDGTEQITAYDGSSSGSGTAVDTAIGMVAPFAMDSVPEGWLHCDGSAVSRDTYSLLYSKVGDTYGAGDGSTTFNLPDLQDEFIRGSSDTLAVGNKQDDEFKAHSHTLTGTAAASAVTGATTEAGNHNHTWGNNAFNQTGAGAGLPGFGNSADGTSWAGLHTHAISGTAAASAITGTANVVGGSETRPRNVAMLYCINATAEPSSGGGETTPAKAPEVTVFKEGSGTYTTPEGALYLTVKMVGGGGGGSAANAVALTAGVGGTTIFGEASCTGGG